MNENVTVFENVYETMDKTLPLKTVDKIFDLV